MLEEVPLPSIPASGLGPATAAGSDYLNYFSVLETYHPDYFDDLPSEIMNHFRTSTPAPRTSSPAPPSSRTAATHSPQLPRFSVHELSALAELPQPRPRPPPAAGPSLVLPPSGRVPYPSFRPEYEDPRHAVTPLVWRPRQYVASSTIRPPQLAAAMARANNRTQELNTELRRLEQLQQQAAAAVPDKITTYRPPFSLQETSTEHPSSEGIARIKSRLAEIITKLRDKERRGGGADVAVLQQWYQQRRKNGQRYYPGNAINPHLPVTSTAASLGNTTEPSLLAGGYFTVRDRDIHGSSGSGPRLQSAALLCVLAALVNTMVKSSHTL